MPLRARPTVEAVERWRHILQQVLFLVNMAKRWTTSNALLREMQRRAPALMGYLDSINQQEIKDAQLDALQITLPSATVGTSLSGKSIKANYPLNPHRCHALLEPPVVVADPSGV